MRRRRGGNWAGYVRSSRLVFVQAPEQKTQPGWWTREHALTLALAAATGLAFYLCYLLVRPFFPALAWALALAVIAHPLHESICRRIRNPNVAAGMSVGMVAVVVVAPAIFVSQVLVGEATAGIEAIRDYVESGHWRETVAQNHWVAPVVRWAERQVNLPDAAERAATAFTSAISSVVKGSVWGAAELLITFFILFYFFRDWRTGLTSLRSLVPLSHAETDEIFRRVEDTIHATIYGTLAVAVVQGALGGVMFWWLGLPAPLLWGVVMALLAIVPVLGAFVVWIPAAIYLALEGHWTKALILVAWGGGVIALIDNLLYPVLVGKRLRLHTLPVFVAIVGGLILFGASGLILGPVALAVTGALVEVWRRRTAGGRPADASAEAWPVGPEGGGRKREEPSKGVAAERVMPRAQE